MIKQIPTQSTRDLIDAGYLVQPTFFSPALPPVDFNKSGIDSIIVDRYRERCAGKKAIVFCVTQAHAEVTAERFTAAGIATATILGTHSKPERDQITERFRNGDLQVLISVTILLDAAWPEVDVVIMAAPTRSRAYFAQQVSTALRPRYAAGMPTDDAEQRRAAIAASGKPKALILDVAGNSLRLGIDQF